MSFPFSKIVGLSNPEPPIMPIFTIIALEKKYFIIIVELKTTVKILISSILPHQNVITLLLSAPLLLTQITIPTCLLFLNSILDNIHIKIRRQKYPLLP